MRALFILIAAGSMVVLAALAGGPILERNRRAGEMRALGAALDQARVSADSCKVALEWEEEEFFRFNAAVDSLRDAVGSYEDPTQGGVPEAEYERYLESFDQYNSSVLSWRERADSLQASEDRCRALIEAHNQLGDSIRTLQAEFRRGLE
jgi:hypothetical protein